MINIFGKNLDITDDEHKYLIQIKKTFGDDAINELFESDGEGKILLVKPPPDKPTSMLVVFFLLNVMLNQRLRSIDSGVTKISELERKVKRLEAKLNSQKP
jgi:hypothetical protein